MHCPCVHLVKPAADVHMVSGGTVCLEYTRVRRGREKLAAKEQEEFFSYINIVRLEIEYSIKKYSRVKH